MFSGEERIRIPLAGIDNNALIRGVVDCFSTLGEVEISKSGSFEIAGKKFASFTHKVDIDGSIRKKDDKAAIEVNYRIQPQIITWIICICFFPFGLAILLLPYNAKMDLERRVEKSCRALRDEFE